MVVNEPTYNNDEFNEKTLHSIGWEGERENEWDFMELR